MARAKDILLQFRNPNSVLLLCMILMIFFTPVTPVSYHPFLYNFLFSCTFIFSVLSLKHEKRKQLVSIACVLVVIVWTAYAIDMPILSLSSRIVQSLFFIYIVTKLIEQTAMAKRVSVGVIADSINGYLLVGVIYTLAAYTISSANPHAYNLPAGDTLDDRVRLSKMFYYTFITYSSTGYGDVSPAVPGARSFATLISVTGQMYVAVIIAMLVGKFSGQPDAEKK